MIWNETFTGTFGHHGTTIEKERLGIPSLSHGQSDGGFCFFQCKTTYQGTQLIGTGEECQYGVTDSAQKA